MRARYRPPMPQLGPLTVSDLCLGTMLMGAATPAADAHRMLDAFVDAGQTLVDTADVYGDGESERTLAPWLARRRDDVVLATKVRFAVSDPGGAGLAPDRIRAACDASLARLGVDVIDLYQVHAPDTEVALEETLEALDGLVRAGKVRALGASNYPAWLLAWAVALQDRHGWSPFVSLQPQYSLVERSVEIELLPFCRAAGLGVLPWGPLGAGFLTGRYQPGGELPAGSRIATPATTSRRRSTAAAPSATTPRSGGRGGRRRAGRHRSPGRHRLAVASARRDRPRARPAHPGAPRRPAARDVAVAVGRAARAPRPPHRAAGLLPHADERRAERHRRDAGRAAAPIAARNPAESRDFRW